MVQHDISSCQNGMRTHRIRIRFAGRKYYGRQFCETDVFQSPSSTNVRNSKMLSNIYWKFNQVVLV